jgi:hypothetical protein
VNSGVSDDYYYKGYQGAYVPRQQQPQRPTATAQGTRPVSKGHSLLAAPQSINRPTVQSIMASVRLESNFPMVLMFFFFLFSSCDARFIQQRLRQNETIEMHRRIGKGSVQTGAESSKGNKYHKTVNKHISPFPQVRSRTRLRSQFVSRRETVGSFDECELECRNERTFNCRSFNFV